MNSRRQLQHPLHLEIEAVRQLIRNAHPAIAEGIKCDIQEIRTHAHALQQLVRQWITHLKTGVTLS